MKTIVTLGVAVALAALSGAPAHAGCGLTLRFDNDLNKDITVQQVDSLATGGSWKGAYTQDFKVGAGKRSRGRSRSRRAAARPACA